MLIFPAIDIIEGRVIRLVKGNFDKPILYEKAPLDFARRYEDEGLTRLHLIDLDGAREKRIVNYKTLETLARWTKLQIDFGGGMQSEKDIEIALECRAKQVNVGSAAVKEEARFIEWLQRFGAETIILAADVAAGKIVVSGWSENTEVSLHDLVARAIEQGIQYVSCTSVDHDGTLAGPAVALYRELSEKFPKLKIIAGGGITSVTDFETLYKIPVYGVIVGRALLEGKVEIAVLRGFNA